MYLKKRADPLTELILKLRGKKLLKLTKSVSKRSGRGEYSPDYSG